MIVVQLLTEASVLTHTKDKLSEEALVNGSNGQRSNIDTDKDPDPLPYYSSADNEI